MTVPLTEKEKLRLQEVLLKHKQIFAENDMDFGRTNLVEHEIKLTNNDPIKERYRKIPPAMYAEVKEHLREMLEKGVIRESKSPYSSPVVLVRKKRDNSLRFCIDYRRLNAITKRDATDLPRIDESFEALKGAKIFSTLDLIKGFWQVPMKEEDKEKTAFTVGPLGHYECEVLPFGLTNSPATFQAMMEKCLGDINLIEIILYLDDINVFSCTVDEHIERLDHVFTRLAAAGLKLQPEKCRLFQCEAKFLGHVVSESGIQTDPEKVEAVKSWPVPQSINDVRKFLGFAGFYRRFIAGFSKIAQPLHAMLKGLETRTLKSGKKKRGPAKGQKFLWGSTQQEAFDNLREKLISAPVLAYADYTKPFIVHTDASLDGLGAAIYQVQDDGKERVVAYASRSLGPTEVNYPPHKLEFLALKWAVTDKFHDYLYGQPDFKVRTDNNPLTYVLSSAKLDATGHRWLAELQNYNFHIEYKAGKLNKDADGLSRRTPRQAEGGAELDIETMPKDSIHALMVGALDLSDFAVEAMCLSTAPVDVLDVPATSLQSLSKKDIIGAQKQDKLCQYVIRLMESDDQGKSSKPVSSSERALYRVRQSFKLIDGIIHRERLVNGVKQSQLLLPVEFQDQALKGLHDHVGHFGVEKTLSLARERFFWPQMATDVAKWVAACGPCVRRKANTNQCADLVNITTSQPMELVCMDFLSLEKSGGCENILVITDHFTGFAQAYPTRSQTAKTTADVLFNNFVCHYGFPSRLHSDQGRNFESAVIKHLCQLANVQKSRTTPYHPQGNGKCERFNRTLLSMLGTLTDDQKSKWKQYVNPLVFAYNCTEHEVHGFSPFQLMFGRKPRLPVDLAFDINPKQGGNQSYGEYVKGLQDRLQYSFGLATERVDEKHESQKRIYDRKARGAVVQVGDRVLVKNVNLRGKQKLADRWEKSVYKVVSQPNSESPVFEVKLENGEGRVRVLHRNLLLPIGDLKLREPLSQESNKTKKLSPNVKCRTRQSVKKTDLDTETECEESSSDEHGFSADEVAPKEPAVHQQQPLPVRRFVHPENTPDPPPEVEGLPPEEEHPPSDSSLASGSEDDNGTDSVSSGHKTNHGDTTGDYESPLEEDAAVQEPELGGSESPESSEEEDVPEPRRSARSTKGKAPERFDAYKLYQQKVRVVRNAPKRPQSRSVPLRHQTSKSSDANLQLQKLQMINNIIQNITSLGK